MGRGRAKAKQTKVARELKYRTTGTDLSALRAELSSDGQRTSTSAGATTPASTDTWDDADDDETGAAYNGAYDDDAEDDWLPSSRRS